MRVSVPCSSCSGEVGLSDDFCPKCGEKVSKALKRELRARLEATDGSVGGKADQVRKASSMLLILAGLFVVGGVVMYFLAQSTADTALAQLRTFPAGSQVTVEGKVYGIEQLRGIV